MLTLEKISTQIVDGNPLNLVKLGLGCLDLTRSNNSIIEYAIQNGITFIDTSDCYGSGESEIAIGEKIKNYDRKKLFICSKGGVFYKSDGVHVCGTEQYLTDACEASLKRLQTSYIDLYYLHRVDPKISLEESISAMRRLVLNGKIKFIGLSEVTADQIQIAHKIHPISAVQIEYSPWSLQDEENGVIEICLKLGIKVVAYSPLGRAFFTQQNDTYFENISKTDIRSLLPRYHGVHLQQNLNIRKSLLILADKKECSFAQLVLAWIMAKGFIVIPGTINKIHFSENIGALKLQFTLQELNEIHCSFKTAKFSGPRYPNVRVSAIYNEVEKEDISHKTTPRSIKDTYLTYSTNAKDNTQLLFNANKSLPDCQPSLNQDTSANEVITPLITPSRKSSK